ncbi:MAG: FtsK/SpoIIIE domain-containing protein, partial [Acidobacteriota bacterium]
RGPRREAMLAETAATDSAVLGDRLLAILREDGLTARLDPPVLAAPAFLRFPVIVSERWRGRSAARLAREIQVRLKLDAPPQLSTDGQRLLIDLQRPDHQTITLAAVLDQVPVGDPRVGSARAPLGVDLAGQLRLIDFSQPEDAHLLIAGAVGSGKSSWLRAALAGLRHSNTPSTLRLILVDPGGRAFVELSQSPYLLEPVIGADGSAVARALAALGAEMERRYQLLEDHGVDSLAALAAVTGCPAPRIFFVCDEYADLILSDRSTRLSIEAEISRLGQRARQVGIHLILATSQPGREIIRGVVDANFPARIGMRMNKAIESKIVLNQPGAETLLGDGDLLFRDIGELTRLQGIWTGPGAA